MLRSVVGRHPGHHEPDRDVERPSRSAPSRSGRSAPSAAGCAPRPPPSRPRRSRRRRRTRRPRARITPRRRSRRSRPRSTGTNGLQLSVVMKKAPTTTNSEQDRHLQRDHRVVGPRRLAHPDGEQRRRRGDDDDRRQVDDPASSLRRNGGLARSCGTWMPTLSSMLDRVARPADGDRRRREQVLEQQVPADEPGEEHAEGRVGVGVGASRPPGSSTPARRSRAPSRRRRRPAITNEMTTAGPAYWAAPVPTVTKIPAPTTLAIPSAVRLNGPSAAESSRRAVAPSPAR